MKFIKEYWFGLAATCTALLILAGFVWLLNGIAETEAAAPKPDQCLRIELFERCMKILPKGPDATMYNDWDEVVAECASTARIHSFRSQSQIKPECLAK